VEGRVLARRAEPAAPIAGRVIDARSGATVAGAEITIVGQLDRSRPTTKDDFSGRLLRYRRST